jgi:hypothetical protein
MSLTGAAHRFRKNMNFDGVETAVRLRHCCHSNKRVLFYVGERSFDDPCNLRVIGDCQFQFGAVARLDHTDGPIDALNGAANANRRRILRPGELSADEWRGQEADKDCRHTNSQRTRKCCAKDRRAKHRFSSLVIFWMRS